MKTVPLFGVPVVAGTKAELLAAASLTQGKIATLNALMASHAKTDATFCKILADVTVIPDGVGVSFALRLLGEKTQTFPGVELAEKLAQNARRIGIWGARAGVAERAFFALKGQNPNLAPAFLLDGYTTPQKTVAATLKATAPDLVLVALGTPRQEREISRLFAAYPRTLYVGVGGALDVLSGDKKRAPLWVRHCRLEWLYRTLKEPKRLLKIPRLALFCLCLPALPLSRIFHKKFRKIVKKFPNPL